jgi:hypothetical protein
MAGSDLVNFRRFRLYGSPSILKIEPDIIWAAFTRVVVRLLQNGDRGVDGWY